VKATDFQGFQRPPVVFLFFIRLFVEKSGCHYGVMVVDHDGVMVVMP
jgi:hypothetical protein